MNKPLVILTRTESDNERVAPFFHAQGLQTLSVPLLEVRDLPVNVEAIPNDFGPYLVLITSSRSTTRWFELRSMLANTNMQGYLVVGKQSALRLKEGTPAIHVLTVSNSAEELLEAIVNLRCPFPYAMEGVAPEAFEILREESPITTLLYPCSTQRRDEAVVGLRKLGFRVIEIPLYEPILPAGNAERLLNALADTGRPTAITFFSPSAVENFFQIISSRGDQSPEQNMPHGLHFAAIGETTADALYEQGIEEVIVSPLPDAEILARTIAEEIG